MGIADARIEYETHGLDVPDLAPDPITQWHRWYDDAMREGCTEPNAMTVATVRPDGTPDARIVLVRGADANGLTFFTNYDSAKGRELAAHPAASAVFGWLQLHRQVRLRGAVERVSEQESDEYFASRPRGSQIGAWASEQSAVIPGRAWLEQRVHDVHGRYEGADVPRPPHWGGYRIVPLEVEFWQGRPSRLHDRLRYRRSPVDGTWIIERLSP
jgi:pyridoxamine 5'-phosphate oxidase